MTLRARVLAAAIGVGLVPLAVYAFGVRDLVSGALATEDQARVETLLETITAKLERDGVRLRARLRALIEEARADNTLRQALVTQGTGDRSYVLDYAERAMRLAGLSALQLQTGPGPMDEGRILSSGHFRNEYDRLDREVRDSLLSLPSAGLTEARRPDGVFLVLAAVDTFSVAGQLFSVMAGESFRDEVLAGLPRFDDLDVQLALPDTDLGMAPDAVVHTVSLPLVRADGIGTARIVVTHRPERLRTVQRRVDGWFAVAAAVGLGLAILVALVLTTRVTRPLAELADTTTRVDLDRLDVEFPERSADEVGALARLLNVMTRRLRASQARVRDVERQATVGELARQVNHDIKNGLVPIRNVVRHLGEVAETAPDQLAPVFRERSSTLNGSIQYLETLSSNYARLYPRPQIEHCDLNRIVETIAPSEPADGVTVRLVLSSGPLVIAADPLMLRRVVENLLANAVESLQAGGGTVTIGTDERGGDGQRMVSLTVNDTGQGMTADEFEHAFDDFFTTKPAGSGLGLSIVRRLVADMNGSVRLESEPGVGTTATLEFPGAPRVEGAT